jgi:hypothetical protein
MELQCVRYGTVLGLAVYVRWGGFVAFDITLEYRIRELCAQAVAAQDTDELQPVLAELRHALREHLEQLRSMVAEYPFST